MKIYCGTDIIEVDRIKEAIENTKEFKENVYTEYEIEKIDKITSSTKYQRYAGRFAVKEAIYKAMSKILIENKISMGFLDLEVRNLEELNNRPKVVFLNEKLKELADRYDIEIDVSISHINSNATAVAVVKLNKE